MTEVLEQRGENPNHGVSAGNERREVDPPEIDSSEATNFFTEWQLEPAEEEEVTSG